jgi:dolichol kinase
MALSLLFFVFLYRIPFPKAIISSVLLSVAIVLVEAVSPHGADNLTIQVTASGLTYLFLKI